MLVEAVAAAGVARGASAGDRYTVRPGDSLWDIAEMKLGTTEARRIARYWPRIHRANRDVIGGDPNLIVPGQVLALPPERP
jgi:nucleoid-associated protein YgaU